MKGSPTLLRYSSTDTQDRVRTRDGDTSSQRGPQSFRRTRGTPGIPPATDIRLTPNDPSNDPTRVGERSVSQSKKNCPWGTSRYPLRLIYRISILKRLRRGNTGSISGSKVLHTSPHLTVVNFPNKSYPPSPPCHLSHDVNLSLTRS